MPKASMATMVMLSHARFKREEAEQTRLLAKHLPKHIVTPEMTACLMAAADQFDRTAAELEERAHALAESIEKPRSLSADVHALLEAALSRIKRMRYPY